MLAAWNVVGTPAPKGSSRAILVRGRAVNVPSGSDENKYRLRSWAHEVITELQAHPLPELLEGPIAVVTLFILQSRKGDLTDDGRLKLRAPFFPKGKPDTDKLLRATFDAITASAAVWHDDAQVAFPFAPRIYAPPGVSTGAWIAVAPAEEYRELFQILDEKVLYHRANADWCRAELRSRPAAGQGKLL
jgi:Holliday junction resolvase RusA-like endonuclease